ncbi:Uncharacterised protein [uncultured archaeon]|nr:Uncharacterised protein [uncultured archaeon]
MKIEEADLYSFYCFDISEEVKLSQIETLLNKKAHESQLKLEKMAPSYMKFKIPPLLIRLPSFTEKFNEVEYSVKSYCKLYSFGTISIIFKTKFNGTSKELRDFSNHLQNKREDFRKKAIAYVEKIVVEAKDSLISSNAFFPSEYYFLVHLKKLDKPLTAIEFQNDHKDLALSIVTGDSGKLSDQTSYDILRNSLSYSPDDFLLLYWNAGLLYDSEINFDSIDVIEFSVVQLLELRYYDSLLENELDHAYDEVKESSDDKKLSKKDYSRARDRLYLIKLSVSDVLEKLENNLKLVGDVYLSKIYNSASIAFHLKEWKISLDRKLDAVDDIYTFLNNKTEYKKSVSHETLILTLEIIVVILILWEVLYPLFFNH